MEADGDLPDNHLVATVTALFATDGPLAARPDFEHRPQQEAMALRVAAALAGGTHLIVEAPTGVGKSLAYLVPAILFAFRKKRKAIVSTHTKNLQEQLLGKDIPIVTSLLDEPFSAVLLKGRRNYLCTSRLQHAIGLTGSMFNREEEEQLRNIYEWSHITPDGDVEHLGFQPSPAVWDMVCSEQNMCSSAICGTTCFFQAAKERVRKANLVIMNHALFFTLMAAQHADDRFIFPDDFVILDEAHTLETVAGTGMGKRLPRSSLIAALHRLYNPRTRKGLVAGIEAFPRDLIRTCEDHITVFFDNVRIAARALAGDPAGREIRTRSPHIVPDTVTDHLTALGNAVERTSREVPSEGARNELLGVGRSLWEARILVREFLDHPEAGFTYWVEFSGPRSTNVTLCASPTNIAEAVGPTLFPDRTSVILTSATLAVNGDLGYFRSRIGAQGVDGVVLDSPFDHRRQMRLCIARGIPEPEAPSWTESLATWILHAIDRTRGGTLALFTSNATLQDVAGRIGPHLADRGISLLVQGMLFNRSQLLETFREDTDSVLFGLDSFWTGVDVPGESLRHVVITRLPFAVPAHPLIEAKMEALAASGRNAFLEYTLPEAILKFRQGAGRLIRSRDDTGIVTVLDARVTSRQYGRFFLSSLPPCPVDWISADGTVTPVDEEW